MKLILLILKDEDKLDDLIIKLTEEKINKITVLDSNSYVSEKKKEKQTNIFSSMRFLIDYSTDESKTILIACDDNQINTVKKVLNKIIPENQYNLIILPDSSSNDLDYHEQLKGISLPCLVLDHHLTDVEISSIICIVVYFFNLFSYSSIAAFRYFSFNFPIHIIFIIYTSINSLSSSW